jgi:methionyl-tRNA synthetase
MTSQRILVTAGLPYSNGNLHVGHVAGCYLPADIFTRYKRSQGHEVRFICGSDDHGVAIQMAAEKEQTTPFELAKRYNHQQQKDFAGLNINFDMYGSTSQSPHHKTLCSQFFKKIYDKGLFEKKVTPQFYNEDTSSFLPDRYIKGTCGYCSTEHQNGDQCENCGKLLDVTSLKNPYTTTGSGKITVKETTHWFLDLAQFQKNVEEWMDKAQMRETTKNYVKSLIESGLVTRSMTRDLSWGVPVPLSDPEAKDKVLYVWFDAPIGYISNTQEMLELAKEKNPNQPFLDLKDWWGSNDSSIYHFIGEDNTIFHCIIWVAMLSAEGSFHLPTGIIVNNFLNIKFPDSEVEKISKSKGRAVWIKDYLASGSNPDILRYYLTSIAPEKARTIYEEEDLVKKNNTDLANVLGNYVNRVTTFTHKYAESRVPALNEEKLDNFDNDFILSMKNCFKEATQHLEQGSTKMALHTIMDFVRDCNKYIDDKKPWATRQTDIELMNNALYYGLWAVKFIAVALHPFMPNTSQKILSGLNLKSELPWKDALTPLKSGDAIGQLEILFQKIEIDKDK